MWLMLQQKDPEDFVIATGRNHSVRDLADIAFSHLGLKYQDYVEVDPQFVRPAEVDVLLGDSSNAKKKLGWQPEVSFEQLVEMMVEADMERLKSKNHKQR
jgi:GDPmannose 4,6-dehydratase